MVHFIDKEIFYRIALFLYQIKIVEWNTGDCHPMMHGLIMNRDGVTQTLNMPRVLRNLFVFIHAPYVWPMKSTLFRWVNAK